MRALPPAGPRHGTRGSGLILTFFGAVWWLTGTVVLDGTVRTAALTAGLAAVVVLATACVRRLDGVGEREAYERSSRVFGWCNAGQGVGIAAAVAVGNLTGEQNWIPGLVAVVVGAHFFPLARPFGHPEYRWTGELLDLVGLAGCGLALAGTSLTGVLTAVGTGSAAALWSTTAWYVLSGARDAARRDTATTPTGPAAPTG
ncbi:hypothetical protein [Streptomyces sparsus]